MTRKFLTLFVSALISGMLITCKTSDEEVFADECQEPKACTYLLMWISMEIKDGAGDPVALDTYYSKNLITGEIYDFQVDDETDAVRRSLGAYPLISDSQLRDLRSSGTPVEFTGKKDGKTLVKETLLIGHDCCHVLLRSGETKIVVE